MDLLNLMREITAFILLIQWTTSDSSSHSIVPVCRKEDDDPLELYSHHTSNPSPIHDLSAELSESQSSLSIRWAIKVDSTIHTLTSTWIQVTSDLKYRCEYQPPFTLKQINLDALQQLWFNFTVSNLPICPSTTYNIWAYNLPPPPDGTGDKYMKSFNTAKVRWNAQIYSVLHDDKIVVTFNASSAADRYTIELTKQSDEKEDLLKTVERKGGCKVGKCQVELEYIGPCEGLTIWITPNFENCQHGSSVWHDVKCTNRSGLAIGAGYILGLLFFLVLLCCCIMCQILRWVRGSKRGPSVRVLVVYPAVDGVFQRAVMLLTQFLQSRGGVTVVIDVWERGSLAEQGPLRWLHTQADLADRVLIILPPQRTETDDLKSNLAPGMTDDTVSASASNLFALTLNLVSSAAHDPHGRDKFWVINLDHDNKGVQTELKGCRTFVLPRDLERLHQQLSGGEIKSLALLTCFRSFYFKNALKHMEINTDFPTCAEANSLDEKSEFLL
ncbi:interleukin-17 receptor B isoform X2 [Ctenopharyngodon idella]|uniref:interleukin-17 receptor B isoform X2 n=1 Tax=Ctenopharyngodon idella TaxID=7959 RepID=UPI00222F07ED|nr:interleukin-17 receptor B isoform X2 [Ctenopharyngodon idella]XP_051758784.1 interleukin-17 receptor B isoform X2 [Ctenopharyngodon idella]